MYQTIKTVRVQHKRVKKGVFWASTIKDFSSYNTSAEMDEMCVGFSVINTMGKDFPSEIIHRMKQFKCAFKDEKQFLRVFNKKTFEFVEKFGFELVLVEGKGIVADTQVFYNPRQVKITPICPNKVRNMFDKHLALSDMKRTINPNNYIIFE